MTEGQGQRINGRRSRSEDLGQKIKGRRWKEEDKGRSKADI